MLALAYWHFKCMCFWYTVIQCHFHSLSVPQPLCACIKDWGCEGKACWQDWSLNPISALCSPWPGDAGKQLAEVSLDAEGTSQGGTSVPTQTKAHLQRQIHKIKIWKRFFFFNLEQLFLLIYLPVDVEAWAHESPGVFIHCAQPKQEAMHLRVLVFHQLTRWQ